MLKRLAKGISHSNSYYEDKSYFYEIKHYIWKDAFYISSKIMIPVSMLV